jgi:hypothetical protein
MCLPYSAAAEADWRVQLERIMDAQLRTYIAHGRKHLLTSGRMAV